MTIKCLKERNYGRAYIHTNKPRAISGGWGVGWRIRFEEKNGTLTSQLANFQLLFDTLKNQENVSVWVREIYF